MKILNLYAGIGGNRKKWGDEHDITAVEWDKDIAKIYQDFFPNDEVIIADAHQYLLEHFKEFDFIWSSPPCPTHSRIRKCYHNQNPPVYPDMKLYKEILLLQGYFKGKYCVENVISWYKPLIEPQKVGRHYFWSNFIIRNKKTPTMDIRYGNTGGKRYGFDIRKKSYGDKRKLLRNCVNPELGLHIFQEAFKEYKTLF